LAVTKFSRLTLVFSALLLVGVVGCGSRSEDTKHEQLTVFAAEPLEQAFTEIGERFKTDNPGASVEFTFGGSADLVLQLAQEAKADVFASGELNDMVKAEQAELVDGKPVEIATGPLAASGQVTDYSITALKDAANPDLAHKFVDLVTTDYGRKVLSEAGFGQP
jgi:molybdate transport system substrate-binding protein